MAAFDQTLVIHSTPDKVVSQIEQIAGPTGQVIPLKPNMLYIVLKNDHGFVYLLRPQPDGTTQLRLIADSAQRVREAFRGKGAKEALFELTNTSAGTASEGLLAAAQQHLATLQQPAQSAPFTSSTTPPVPLMSDPSNDPQLTSILSKKPLTKIQEYANRPTPWNPGRIFGYIPIASTVGVGIALAWNWRRLGKPQWFLPSLAAIIGAIVLTFILLVGMLGTHPSEIGLSLIAIVLLVGFWGVPATLWLAQRGPYKAWEKTGDWNALLAYQYDFTMPLLIGMGGAVVIAMLVSGIVIINSQPHQVVKDEVTLTVPSGWNEMAFKDIPDCNGQGYSCIYALREGRYGFTLMILMKTHVNAGRTASGMENTTWNSINEDFEGLKLDKRENLTVNNLPANRRFFYAPNWLKNRPDSYAMQMFIIKGTTAYQLTVVSINRGVFYEEFKYVDSFAKGIAIQ